MVYSRRYRRSRMLKIIACIAAAALLLTAGVLFMMHRRRAKSLSSVNPPEGSVFAVRFGSDPSFAAAAPEELDAYFAQAADFAQQHGMNALVFDVLNSADGIGFCDRSFETWKGASAKDSLFHKYDPLYSLCRQASQRGLAVYAAVPEISGDKHWEKSLSRLKKNYPIAGLYVETDTLFDSDTQAPVFYAGTAVFDDPGRLFLAAMQKDAPGIVLDYRTCLERPEDFSVLASAVNSAPSRPTLLGYVPPASLSVGYPADGAKIYTETCFVMGTSDPSRPLTLNGNPVMQRAPGGTFGVLTMLDYGENVLTLSQGGETVSITVTRPQPPAGGNTAPSAMEHDATVPAEKGSPVRIEGWLTSLLYDPENDSNINETVRRGAVARVEESVETVRRGKKTWAYRLESGDYVLAYNTTVLSGPAETGFAFTGAQAQPTAAGETVTFTGKGTPLAYTNMVDGNLVMDFYDADFAADFSVQGSSMIQSVSTESKGSYTRVTFTFTQPVWGHTVEYTEDGTTQVLLKKQPVRSDIFAKPLTGVSVLLDAGHGDHDTGAMGAPGPDAPAEKDVNLALMKAVQYRLEQMGASVQTIRTDDTFLSLEDRNRAIITGQPDFFISLHHNSIDLRVDANHSSGTECYYFYPAGKEFAKDLAAQVSAAAGRENRGAHWGYYYVTRSTVCPAVLLESGFMVNPSEYEQVVSDESLWAVGDAVARSILACVPKA